MRVLRVTEETPGLEEDDGEYVTLSDVPFTGVYEDRVGERLDAEVGYRNGRHHGRWLEYATDGSGRPTRFMQMREGTVTGPLIEFDEKGDSRRVERNYRSVPIKRVLLDGGAPVAVPIEDAGERLSLLQISRDVVDQELADVPTIDLLNDTLRKMRSGELWGEPHLVVEDD